MNPFQPQCQAIVGPQKRLFVLGSSARDMKLDPTFKDLGVGGIT